ncbi:MAG: hypothetical protein U1F68_13685 [Gammaproteobacteria bacterium]
MADKFFPDDRQDYVEIPREDGSSKGTNVFYRYAGGGASGNSGTFRVRMKNLKVTEQVLSGARGLSTFQLFMTFALGKKPNGAFDLQIADATVDAPYHRQPESYFWTLVISERSTTNTKHPWIPAALSQRLRSSRTNTSSRKTNRLATMAKRAAATGARISRGFAQKRCATNWIM